VTSARKEPQPDALNRREQRDALTRHVGESGRIVNITDVLTNHYQSRPEARI
jgi:hypothetical protein